MKLSADLLAFSGRIGHQFRQPDLLVRAVTHASISSVTRPDNQRLEFLGDRVLGLAMAEALLRADAAASEGQLAPRYNALVRKETCADVARQIGLGDVLKLGRSEMMSGGRRKEALLGDALEAVIAAVYLDAGFEAAQAEIAAAVMRALDAEAKAQAAQEAATALQASLSEASSQLQDAQAHRAAAHEDEAHEGLVRELEAANAELRREKEELQRQASDRRGERFPSALDRGAQVRIPG